MNKRRALTLRLERCADFAAKTARNACRGVMKAYYPRGKVESS
jgi:hypothetical protein